MRQLVVGKGSKETKERDLYSCCEKSHKHTKLQNHSISMEEIVQTEAGSLSMDSVSVSHYDPCLIDCVGLIFLVSLILLDPIILPPLFFSAQKAA